MTFTEIGLLLVTFGALALGIWVFAPSNKDYFDRMGEIPLDDDLLCEQEQRGNQRD